nr:SPOR domain-containing protein [uncultured Carboxylicivirga sp.]
MRLKLIMIITAIMVSTVSGVADDIAHLRTSKKIIRMDEAEAPYWAIQIIALKRPPGVASFFQAVDVAREYVCTDGFVRYTVGQYNTYEEAKSHIDEIKVLGYDQAFVVNTAEYKMKNEETFKSSSSLKIDPSKTYTVQLSAFRFPVYLSHFENVDNVMEFRMKDKIFRYTVGKFPGTEAKEELQKIKDLGYKKAFLVELDKYMPFKIE